MGGSCSGGGRPCRNLPLSSSSCWLTELSFTIAGFSGQNRKYLPTCCRNSNATMTPQYDGQNTLPPAGHVAQTMVAQAVCRRSTNRSEFNTKRIALTRTCCTGNPGQYVCLGEGFDKQVEQHLTQAKLGNQPPNLRTDSSPRLCMSNCTHPHRSTLTDCRTL